MQGILIFVEAVFVVGLVAAFASYFVFRRRLKESRGRESQGSDEGG